MTRHLLAMAAVVYGLTAPAVGQDKGKTDDERIKGNWKVSSVEKGGMKVDDSIPPDVILHFADGQLKMTSASDNKEMRGTYKLDGAKKPREIDITVGEGGKEHTVRGIYELTGDTLKLCISHAPDPRPTEFSTQAGSNNQLIVLKRDK
jgi:uncharacterized protein (TIGR03067 family)